MKLKKTPQYFSTEPFLVKELSVHTRHFLHNFALPFPQRSIPTTFWKSYITAILCHDVFGREAFNATIKEWEEADLLNQLHHACC